jgi:hypothetical protein
MKHHRRHIHQPSEQVAQVYYWQEIKMYCHFWLQPFFLTSGTTEPIPSSLSTSQLYLPLTITPF